MGVIVIEALLLYQSGFQIHSLSQGETLRLTNGPLKDEICNPATNINFEEKVLSIK